MRNLTLAITAAASLALASALSVPAIAQTTQQQGADSNQHSAPVQTDGSGKTVGDPSQNPGPPGAPVNKMPSDSPDKQPPVATGEDLKGPPKAFPSNKAPE